MEIIEYLKESCQEQHDIKSILRIFGAANKEQNKQPLSALTNTKAMALTLNWLAWHGENGKQIELRLVETKEQIVYTVGLVLRKDGIYVQYVRSVPELVDKMLHHWHYTTTYQTLSVEDIKDSVENADILNMLNTVCNTNKDTSDSDLEI